MIFCENTHPQSSKTYCGFRWDNAKCIEKHEEVLFLIFDITIIEKLNIKANKFKKNISVFIPGSYYSAYKEKYCSIDDIRKG